MKNEVENILILTQSQNKNVGITMSDQPCVIFKSQHTF
jgi:hypothetical protein